MTSTALFVCPNCGNDDARDFLIPSDPTGTAFRNRSARHFQDGYEAPRDDVLLDDCVCTRCGACIRDFGPEQQQDPQLLQRPDPERGVPPERRSEPANRLKEFKGSYQRRAHLSERLSAACCMEPTIPDEDYAEIRAADHVYRRQGIRYYFAGDSPKRVVTKRDVQRVLRLVDERRYQRGAELEVEAQAIADGIHLMTRQQVAVEWEEADWWKNRNVFATMEWESVECWRKRQADEYDRALQASAKARELQCKRFSIKYLEKWKSIKSFMLGGAPLRSMTVDQLNTIGTRINTYSSMWDLLQPPSQKHNRHLWAFPERKHFPAINFMIQKAIEELLNEGKFDRAFEEMLDKAKHTNNGDTELFDECVRMLKANGRITNDMDAATVKALVVRQLAASSAAVIKADFPLPQRATLANVGRYYVFLSNLRRAFEEARGINHKRRKLTAKADAAAARVRKAQRSMDQYLVHGARDRIRHAHRQLAEAVARVEKAQLSMEEFLIGGKRVGTPTPEEPAAKRKR